MEELPQDRWVADLEAFISARLMTVKYTDAARVHPGISEPFCLLHSQPLLDGFVWAVNDHPSFGKETWRVIEEHIQRMHQQLQDTIDTQSKCRHSHISEGEKEYRLRAAVQDVYTAFCVLDAFMKSQPVLQQKPLREAVERALPQYVSQYFPTFFISTELSQWRKAEESFRWRFWDLLRAWLQPPPPLMLSESTHRRLEQFLRYTLKTRRENEDKKRALSSQHSVPPQGLLPQVLAASASPSLAPAQGDEEASGEVIKSFVNSIFPSRHLPAFRLQCHHCGAPFDDEDAIQKHYRYHFHSHNALRQDVKMVRLLNPSSTDFVEYIGDVDRSGYFPEITAPIESAYRSGGSSGSMNVRRRATTAGA